MKPSTRLDSAVFQLTPTRTRCDFVISANGKTEKVASGLLNPFIVQLKTAQDQVAKGGYSIILQPETGTDALWFTKATIERFVRFVSSPEILERVYTLESEILQIEEAISIQGNNEMALMVEENQARHSESVEGHRPFPDGNNEKAIVLYEPGLQSHEANGSTPEENSKVQLVKVLETRKAMLQKEQGMAFARAVAAGFNIDNMFPLLTFSDSFGASRLKDACARFKELWKKKHEMSQWLEIEGAEAMSSRSDFSAMNASGIMLSSVANKHNELKETLPELPLETNGKSTGTTSIDEKPAMYNQLTNGYQEYFQGQYPHQMYPPWTIHFSPGALPVFQGFPMQGMPYYQNYPGAGPYYQPPYSMAEDSRLNPGQRIQKRHSMDSSNSQVEPEAWDTDALRTISLDDAHLEKEDSQIQESQKRASGLSKKQSAMVVVQNVNYITSKKLNSSDTESQSVDSQIGKEDESGSLEQKHKKSQRSSKRQGGRTEKHYAQDKEAADGGHWQAFQNLLLKNADDDKHAVDRGMFAVEKKAPMRRQHNTVGNDPIVFDDQGAFKVQKGAVVNMHKMSGIDTHMPKNSNDEYFISERVSQFSNGGGHMNLQSTEVDGRRVGYRRCSNDDFMRRPVNRSGFMSSPSDLLAMNGFDRTANGTNRRSSHNMDSDSYIVSLRSSGLDQISIDNRNAMDMDSEVPAATKGLENISTRAGKQVNYEPDGLILMLHRGSENGASGYDPAFDHEMQVQAEVDVLLNKKNKEVVTDNKKGVKKLEKDQKMKMIRVSSDKMKLVGPIRRRKPSKLSPLDEARARAEKVKTLKADLQKMKKEKQEEEMKRIEALKIARQKRNATGNSIIPTRSALSSQQTRKQIPTKTSSSLHRGSKFSDSEPGPSSPLQIYRIRTFLGSSSTEKTSKPSRLNTGSHSTRNKLTRSAPSLPEPKKENTGGVSTDTKASMARIRRLSEPKMSSSHHVSSIKSRNNEITSKSKLSARSESKKASAIVNHDTSKTSKLPELKIRTGKGPAVKSKSVNEMTQKGSRNKPSATSGGVEPMRKNENILHHNVRDDNVVIDKTIVILECEKLSFPAITVSEDNAKVKEDYCGIKIGEKSEVESRFAAIHSSASSQTKRAVGREPTGKPFHAKIDTQKVSVGGSGKESIKFSNIAISEKTYQASHARVSSFEDPHTRNLEYGKTQPTNLESTATSSVAVRAHFSGYRDLKLEKIPEVLEKPQVKKSPKGLKRLLMFGKKNHSSAACECNADSDNISCCHSGTNSAPRNEASLHFSFLSPFRIKTSEKKPRA